MICAFFLGVDVWGEGELQFVLGGYPLSWGRPLPSHPDDHVALDGCHSGGASTLREPSEHQRPREPQGGVQRGGPGGGPGWGEARLRGGGAATRQGREVWRVPAHTRHPGAGNRPTRTLRGHTPRAKCKPQSCEPARQRPCRGRAQKEPVGALPAQAAFLAPHCPLVDAAGTVTKTRHLSPEGPTSRGTRRTITNGFFFLKASLKEVKQLGP